MGKHWDFIISLWKLWLHELICTLQYLFVFLYLRIWEHM
jgi:hypothetical protein